jgi:hypothetical protein
MPLFEIVGWAGAITFVVAYLLLSLKVLSPDRIPYHAMNAAGGLFLVINSVHLDDRPALFVNFIWMGIALYSILNILRISLKMRRKDTTP